MTIVDMDAHPPFKGNQISYTGIMTADGFFDRLSRVGIGVACGLPLLPDGWQGSAEEAVVWMSDASLKLGREYPSRYIPVVAVHPSCPALSCRQIERGKQAGVRLAGELSGEWLADDMRASLTTIMTCAADHEMAVSARLKSVEEAVQWAERYPLNQLLLCFVCNIMPVDVVKLLSTYPHLHMILSAPSMAWNYFLHEMIGRCPVEWLLFGTRFPHINVASRKASIEWELRDQPESVKDAVFGGNALRLAGGGLAGESEG